MDEAAQNKTRLSWVAKVFLAVFFIVLFEGALRKWLFLPTMPLMLLRDSLVLIAVIYGIGTSSYRFRAVPEILMTVWSVIVLIWAMLQYIFQIMPFPVLFIGIRSWLFYLWFAVLFARKASSYDITVIIKTVLATLIPMVSLAVYQHLSPVNAFINRQVEGKVFTVTSNIVRATGTFSFTIGYTAYMAMVMPLVFWLMTDGTKFFKNYSYRMLLIGSYFLGVLVSGSRGALFLTIGVMGVWIIVVIVSGTYKKVSSKTLYLLPLMLAVGIYLLIPILQRALEANTTRIELASQSEDLSDRIVNTFLGTDKTWENFDIAGRGIGAASNAAGAFMHTSGEGFVMGENEIDRILNEGGILGFLFEFLKIAVALTGLLISFKILRREKIALPLLFWVYLTIELLTATLTGQITIHGIVFLSLGIGWSLLRKPVRKLYAS